MSTTFGVFARIEGSDRYALQSTINSPYETESLDDQTMVRDITSFNADIIDVETILEENIVSANMLSFGADGSVALHPDITSVEIVEGMVADPVDGMNEVIVTIGDKTYSSSFTSTVGSYLRAAHPTGYEVP